MEKYTEDEAKTKKACPMTRNKKDIPYYNCLGSTCMKWCWLMIAEHNGDFKVKYIKSDKGYCGL